MQGILKAQKKAMVFWLNTDLSFNAIFNNGLFSGKLDVGYATLERVKSDNKYHYFSGNVGEYRIEKKLWSSFLTLGTGVRNPTKNKKGKRK